MIKIEGLSKSYKKDRVLKNITLELKDGDVLGVVGPNGAGKSTLLSLLATLMSQDEGTIDYGLKADNLKELRKHIAYVPQDIALFEEMTVEENLDIFYSENIRNLKHMEEVMEVMKLGEYSSYKVKKLSGGMKRRVNMAISLLKDTKIILMDEPVVGVEYFIRRDIEKYIKVLSKRGKIILMTSHMKEFLDHTCNRLLVLDDGEMKYFGDYYEDMDYFKKID
jgi:ABC-2 type transport system ATP-binding protein